MIKLNNKGFTLVELLACLAILSIIMLVTVPSTLNILDKSKKQTYLADAKKVIALADSYMRGHTDVEYPTSNKILVLKLGTINDGTVDEDPEGNKYDKDASFVAIGYKADGDKFEYTFYTQIVGVKDATNNRGVILSNNEELNSDQKYALVEKKLNTTIDCAVISKKIYNNQSGTCIYK